MSAISNPATNDHARKQRLPAMTFEALLVHAGRGANVDSIGLSIKHYKIYKATAAAKGQKREHY